MPEGLNQPEPMGMSGDDRAPADNPLVALLRRTLYTANGTQVVYKAKRYPLNDPDLADGGLKEAIKLVEAELRALRNSI